LKKREVQSWIVEQLKSEYDLRESNNMAKILLEDLLHIDISVLNYDVNEEEVEELKKALVSLKAYKPIQYVTGIADFYGCKFNVNEHTLIPRPETEELVYKVLQDYKSKEEVKVLDIGTGSGCIPIAIANEKKSWVVTAVDISEEALEISESNAKLNGVQVDFRHLDILEESQWESDEKWDVIISNPPYIPIQEKLFMHKNVLDYEPHLALFVYDEDPLLFYHKILKFAIDRLEKNGKIYFECNEFNASLLRDKVIAMSGYTFVELVADLQGKDRVLIVQKR